ncbi:MAG: lipopolysaccharide biosynthesis protein [Phycisphaerae bacterium]|nr:lipopolysaccharide biosynthesis protein [Phycisphaerae bacterium]
MTDNNNINIQKKEPDLYKRSVKGGYWVISSRFAVQLLGFVKSLFIVNFFFLNDLGIISAAVMMMEILSTFTQTGFESALIQKKGDIHDYLDTAWTAGIIKGIVLFLTLYFAAPLLATFRIPEEKVPLAIGIFRAMSVCFLISGFRNIGAIYFSKNLDFHKTFALSMVSTLTDIVLSVGLVLFFRSIWGVIAARLVTACINCTSTYILSSYRPRLHFERAKARELWKFGRWIFGGNIISYLLEAGDDYFVWSYLGIQSLALYRYAYRFSNMPATHITSVISQVSFPAYSKIQDDLPRLREAYLKVLKITALFSVPTAFLIFILGPDFVHLFLPERMYPMIPALQLLAIVGLITSLGGVIGPVLKATGKLVPVLYFQGGRLALLAILIYPFTKMWGIAGTALAIALTRVLMYPPGLLFVCRLVNCSIWKVIQPLLIPLAASTMMAFVTFLLKFSVFTEVHFLSFFGSLLLALAIYLTTVWLMDSIFNCEIRKIVRENFTAIRWKHRKNTGIY